MTSIPCKYCVNGRTDGGYRCEDCEGKGRITLCEECGEITELCECEAEDDENDESNIMTIFKYELFPESTTIEMPDGAEILSAQSQHDSIFLWARVHPKELNYPRRFAVFGTGHEMPQDQLYSFIDTVQMNGGSLVFHVFEI